MFLLILLEQVAVVFIFLGKKDSKKSKCENKFKMKEKKKHTKFSNRGHG